MPILTRDGHPVTENGHPRNGNAGDKCCCQKPAPHYYRIPFRCRDNVPADFGVPDTIIQLISEQNLSGCGTTQFPVFSHNGQCYFFQNTDLIEIKEGQTFPLINTVPERICTCADCLKCWKCGNNHCMGRSAYVRLEASVSATYRVVPWDAPRPPMPSGPSLDTGYGFQGGWIKYYTSTVSAMDSDCGCVVKQRTIIYNTDGSIGADFEDENAYGDTDTIGGLPIPAGMGLDDIMINDCYAFQGQYYWVDEFPGEYTLVRVAYIKASLESNECDCGEDCSHNNEALPATGGV